MILGHGKAPELEGGPWFNSKPLTAADLEGKVVLYDFWTYSCVNCQRTLPYLRDWWERYQGEDFVMIGIHTPEFDFEKKEGNVEQAIKDNEVTWPVVMDSNFVNWKNFANHYWPAKYLTNKDGKIVYTHFGEGSYDKTEAKIRKLLGTSIAAGDKEAHEHVQGKVCFRPTPETYCGFARGALDNEGGYRNGEVFDYPEPKEIGRSAIALKGKFQAMAEFVQSSGVGAALRLNFHATEVNLVMHPVGERSIVTVTYNGEPLPANIRGKAVSEDSEISITTPTLYNIIDSDQPLEGELVLTSKAGDFQAFAYTFSGCT